MPYNETYGYLRYESLEDLDVIFEKKPIKHIECVNKEINLMEGLFAALMKTGVNAGLQIVFYQFDLTTIKLFADYLKSGKSPKNLTFSLKSLDVLNFSGVVFLADALQSRGCMEGLSLDLFGQDIGNEGLLTFMRALESGNAPEKLTLVLPNCSITQFGWSEEGIDFEKFPRGFTLDLRNYSTTWDTDPLQRMLESYNHIQENTAIALLNYLKKARPLDMTLHLCSSVSPKTQQDISTLLQFATSFNQIPSLKKLEEQLGIVPLSQDLREIILNYLTCVSLNHDIKFYERLWLIMGNLFTPNNLAQLPQSQALRSIHDVYEASTTSCARDKYYPSQAFFIPENKMEPMGSPKIYWLNVLRLKLKSEFPEIQTFRFNEDPEQLEIELSSKAEAESFKSKLDRACYSRKVMSKIQDNHLTISGKSLFNFLYNYGIGLRNHYFINFLEKRREERSCTLM